MGEPAEFQRILVPVDFYDASEEVIAAGKAVKVGSQHIDFAPAAVRSIRVASHISGISPATTRLLLVHATPTLNYSAMYTGPAGLNLPAAIVEEIHERARTTSLELLRMLAKNHAPDRNVEFVARPGVALSVIQEEAQRFKADLIVMAASGSSRVTRLFVGSTADRIIRSSECPVLVVPAIPH